MISEAATYVSEVHGSWTTFSKSIYQIEVWAAKGIEARHSARAIVERGVTQFAALKLEMGVSDQLVLVLAILQLLVGTWF